MEFYSIISAGAGSFMVVPTCCIVGGALVMALLAVIKAFIDGCADKIYAFADSYTWIVVLVIVIISIIITFFVGRGLGKKLIHITFLFGASLMLSLSLCYSEVIYWVGSFAEKLEEVFLVTLFVSPWFLIFLIIQLAVTLIFGLIIVFPTFSENFTDKTISIFSSVIGIASNGIMIYLLLASKIPEYMLHNI